MSDTFEDVAKCKGETIMFHVQDGTPVTGKIVEADEATHTVTLADKRVIKFPAPPAKVKP